MWWIIYTYIIVELRTLAMPFGLGAFVAVKLRSLRWQRRFEQGWWCREVEVQRAAERGRKCHQAPGEGQSAAGSSKRGGQIANMHVHITSVKQGCLWIESHAAKAVKDTWQ